ncbi:MAG: AMP-binding protein [Anaerolinea sp.]
MNTADYLLERGRDDDVALVLPEHRYTYADIRQGSSRVLAALLQCGVQPGDRVAILGANSFFWVCSYLAILKSGAIAVPLATTHTPEETQKFIAFTGTRIVLAEKRLYPKFLASLDGQIGTLFEDILSSSQSVWDVPDLHFNLDQDAALMSTSGTTARPRAVRVTHRNIQANTNSIIEYLELDSSERMMAVLPFYYCFGTSLLHTHLRVGASLVCGGSFTYPETVLDLMEATQCTGFAGVPAIYQTLLRNSSFPRRKWTYLRKLQQAGGKLQNILIQELMHAVPHAKIFVMYGQTEATARLSYLPPDLLPHKLGSIGKGIPGVTLRVLNEEGKPVKPDEVGEIYARGDNICPGYWDDPEATAEKFVNGELKTGDLATVDADGFFYIVDRKADFIKTYGYRVSSQQVEAVLMEIPDLVAAAVIGEPDLVRGEAILAFVVLRDGATLNEKEILTHCAKRLPNYMVPRDVYFVPALPTNAHGKVVKTELRKQISRKETL